MRKLILQEFVTLNGLAAGPNDSVDFVPAATRGDQAFGQAQLALMDSIDAILLGRVTYQMFAAYWPEQKEGDEKPFADKLNAIPKIVFSRTLDSAPWGSWNPAMIVKADAAQEVATLRKQAGKDMIVWGSISLAQSLSKAGLIDEYHLVLCPTVLGKGKPLFAESPDAIAMKLLSTRSYDLGAVSVRYSVAASV